MQNFEGGKLLMCYFCKSFINFATQDREKKLIPITQYLNH